MTISLFFFSSRRRHTRSLCDWSSDVCSSDLRIRGHEGDLKIMRASKPPSSETHSLNQAAPPDCLPWKTFLSSAGLGFVLGAVVWRGPIYSLEIAQIAAGLVDLPPLHPIYAHH